MSDLLAARCQMAMSLAFHINFAIVGIGMPLLMIIAEWRWLKTRDPVYLELARRWAKGTAIMFAVGAVSGTVLSFELGLLWPRFMAFAGPVIGLPFAMEGFAFFLEAIFLGIYLYGWDRVPEKVHWFAGFMVMICGTLSGVFVVTANAWMNAPTGFDLVDGLPANIQPWTAMWGPAAPTQTAHMTVAAFQALAFAVAAIHAWVLLKRGSNPFHRKALSIALVVACVTGLVQPIVGDLSAKMVAEMQPVKLAAMEGHWHTEKGAALRIGGWPDETAEETRYSLDIPYLLSILAFADPQAEVKGLKDFPVEDRPPVAVTHIAFQVMIGLGTLMALTAVIVLLAWWKKPEYLTHPRMLKLLIINGPAGVLAVQAGWIVTEVGRQPWVVHGYLRTADAVTPMPGVQYSLMLFTALYFLLGWVVVALLKRQVFQTLPAKDTEAS